jgi:hypothetical protein
MSERTHQPTVPPPTRAGKPAVAVLQGKALADLVRGKNLLFKARNYMGPVHIDEVSCSTRWFNLKMTTRPWPSCEVPRTLL